MHAIEWVEHDGRGLPPGMGENSFPLVRFRGGSECAEFPANERLWDWSLGAPAACDIVAYRLDPRDIVRQHRQRLKAAQTARREASISAA